MRGGAAKRTAAIFPWRSLRRPLDAAQRALVAGCLRSLLGWQSSLARWPAPTDGLPDATPFVSLYAHGRLVGCFGSDEGPPGERLVRAFLRALEDVRWGGVGARERPRLAAQVSYPIRARVLSSDRAAEDLEVGTHGIGLADGRGAPVVILPQVARDARTNAAELLQIAARKAGLAPEGWRAGKLALFETEDVGARPGPAASPRGADPRSWGAAWLGRIVGPDGAVCFAIDGRTGARHETGPMHHGRAAWVLRALRAYAHDDPRLARAAARAHRRLARDITSALSGRRVEAWPQDPAMVAGTCALALLAGIPVERELHRMAAQRSELSTTAWHAAQVVLALGPGAPDALWRACVDDLDEKPWAPWTLMAARARGDAVVASRAERAVAASIRRSAPHAGGSDVTGVPELALTALALEALGPSRSAAARRAVREGSEFLLRWQIRGTKAALDVDEVHGAFPVSPVVAIARADVTSHVLLALQGAGGPA